MFQPSSRKSQYGWIAIIIGKPIFVFGSDI